MPPSDLKIRCTCKTQPLLALAGRDQKTGLPFVWLRVHKQGRVYGEMIATEGVVHLRCRVCLRWTQLTIERVRNETVDQQPSHLSPEVTTESL